MRMTNDSGDYAFVEVVPGTYQVEFELTGFKKNVQNGVIARRQSGHDAELGAAVGAAQETVEVTSEAPQVDTTSTQLGAVINDRSVNELPLNARDTYQFLQLQPGVQSQLGSAAATCSMAQRCRFGLRQWRPHPGQQLQRERRRRQRSVRQPADGAADARQHRGISRNHQHIRRRIRTQLRLRGKRRLPSPERMAFTATSTSISATRF